MEHKELVNRLNKLCVERNNKDEINPDFDSGVRATLRKGLISNEPSHEVIPFLYRCGMKSDDTRNLIPYQIAAGLFATIQRNQASSVGASGFGHFCRRIAFDRQLEKNQIQEGNSLVPRFERMLRCRRTIELIPHIRAFARMKDSGEQSNHKDFELKWSQFLRDLIFWESQWHKERGPRMKWAREFWSYSSEQEGTTKS